jgi:hypothetical protein
VVTSAGVGGMLRCGVEGLVRTGAIFQQNRQNFFWLGGGKGLLRGSSLHPKELMGRFGSHFVIIPHASIIVLLSRYLYVVGRDFFLEKRGWIWDGNGFL